MKKLVDRVVYAYGLYWIEGDYIKILTTEMLTKDSLPAGIVVDGDIKCSEFKEQTFPEYNFYSNLKLKKED